MTRRLRTLVPLAAVLALLVVLSACAAQTLELTKDDDGSTQSLDTGQQMAIGLEANPSTGYAWAVDGELPAQLTQSGEPEYAAESGLVGASGVETWRFTAAEPGEGVLKLKYWRSFEPTVAPIETFSVTVEVD